MKPPPPLTLVPRRSRFAIALILSTHAATAVLVASLALPWLFRAVAVVVVVLACAWTLRAIVWDMPRSIRVGIDRRIGVTLREGVVIAGDILDDSYVGPRVTTIVWRADGTRRTRALLVLPDAFAGEDFRRLRVMLRYSRAPPGGRSDEEAG